jgi:nucleoside-diphosphate-sugar epimerase
MERGLRAIDMPTTVVRVPLVYGPGVRGNFRRLIEAVDRGWPLPLAAVDNLRSMLAVGNLCDFLLRVADEPAAAGETYLLADGEDVSMPDLLRRLAAVLGRPSRLFPVPPRLLEAALRVVGQGGAADRLLGDLRVDASRARALGWLPPIALDEGLAAAVRPAQGLWNT